MVIIWSAPATDSIFATSFALIGARDLSWTQTRDLIKYHREWNKRYEKIGKIEQKIH